MKEVEVASSLRLDARKEVKLEVDCLRVGGLSKFLYYYAIQMTHWPIYFKLWEDILQT